MRIYFLMGAAQISKQGKRILIFSILIIAAAIIFSVFGPPAQEREREKPIYMVQIDAGTVLEGDSVTLLNHLADANVNTVALQVFPNEGEKKVYWKSDIAPSGDDALSAFIDLAHKKNIGIWAWMTTLDMPWIYETHPEWRVRAYKDGAYTTETGEYKRISPCVNEHREYIGKVYYELVSKYDIDGVLLQDDLYMERGEDFSDACKEAFKKEFGQELTPEVLDSDLSGKFYEWRSEQLTAVVKGVRQSIRRANPRAKLAVNVYPDSVVGKTDSNYDEYLQYIGQNYAAISDNADYAAVMAYHRTDNQPVEWVKEVARQALLQADPKKVIIKVQGIDWVSGKKLPDAEVKRALALAEEAGARNFGIYLWNFDISDFGIVFGKALAQLTGISI